MSFDVTDCLEILDVINLNSHYYDEERYEDWLDQFTPDATLELPWGDVLTGCEEMQQIVDVNNQSLAMSSCSRAAVSTTSLDLFRDVSSDSNPRESGNRPIVTSEPHQRPPNPVNTQNDPFELAAIGEFGCSKSPRITGS